MSYDNDDFNPFENIITELPSDFAGPRAKSKGGGALQGDYCDPGVYDFEIVDQPAPTQCRADKTWAKHKFKLKDAAGHTAYGEVNTYTAKVTFSYGTFESPKEFGMLEQFLTAIGAKILPSAPGSKTKFNLADMAKKIPQIFAPGALVGLRFRAHYGRPSPGCYAKWVSGKECVLADVETDQPVLINDEEQRGERAGLENLAKAHKLKFKKYCEILEFKPLPPEALTEQVPF